jgi:hypothetical protein
MWHMERLIPSEPETKIIALICRGGWRDKGRQQQRA